MRLLTLLLALLAVTLAPRAAGAPRGSQDPLVAQAVKRIAEVEAAEAKLQAGDVAGADRELNRLAWAGKRLDAVVQKGTAEWKAAKGRHDAVKQKIEAKKAAPAPKTPPGGTPPKTPPPTPPGGTPPQGTPPKTPPAGPAYDHEKVVRLNEDISRAFENLKLLQFKNFLDDNRVGGLRREIEGFEERLAAFHADHPNVKIVAENLENHRKLFQVGVDRVAADAKTAPEIRAKLDVLFDKYSDEDFPTRIEPPYSEGQVRAWARELHRRRTELLPADLEWLRSVSGNVVVGANRFLSVESNLTGSVQLRLEESQRYVVESLDGRARDGVEFAGWILETDTKDRDQVLNRILGKGRFDENMARLREAAHFVAMAGIMDGELARKDAPDRAQQTKRIDAAIVRLRELARLTLSEVRLPKSASEDPELLKIAAETLKKEDYGVGAWKRLVINAPLKEQTRREAWLDPGTVRATITFYDYVWEEFQVTTVEEVDGELWLFANTLKRYSSGDRTTPVGRWILSRRFELTPILAENLDR